MNDNLKASPQARKMRKLQPARSLLLFSLVSFCLLLACAADSGAQESNPAPAPRVNRSETKQAAENQQSSNARISTAASRTGSLTGRVLGDDGRPVANATVAVFGIGASVPPSGDITDADGKFSINGLRPTSYSVQAFAPGYVVVPEAGAEIGVPRFYRIGDNINLTMVKGGVITGTVTDASGEAVIASVVRAIRVREGSKRPANIMSYGIPRMTDDRGVYRLYGLEPGVYIIAVGSGGGQTFGVPNAYEGNAPTYYPSATRDTAAELTLHAGEELTGIDVRYRGERGYTVSGSVSGVTDSGSSFSGVTINLLRAASGTQESLAFIGGDENNRSFALNGIADGEYTLTAMRALGNTSEVLTASRKISVRGSDVTGLELKLEPLGSLAGHVALDPPPKIDCTRERNSVLEEITITARQEGKEQADEGVLSFLRRIPATPNDKGEFKLNNLRRGRHRLDVQLPGDDWYVRAIAMPNVAAGAKAATTQSKMPMPGEFTIKQGERIAGLSVAVGQGAANLRGRVAAASEGVNLPARLRVYLVPIEQERVVDLLRYAEAVVESDGRFALSHIAPGRYWLLARDDKVKETESAEHLPVALDAVERDKLRREAESAGAKIDLQPCQRLADYVLNYGATPPK